jgi:hypothetical protein
MKNNDEQKRFADSLLRQDAPISEIQLKEYRMRLEEKLDAAAQNERRMRWLAIGVWLIAILLPFGIIVIDRLQRGMSWLPPVRLAIPPEVHAVSGALGHVVDFIYMITLSFAWVIVFVYLCKSRPALRRAKDEHQAALLAHLQQQIEELKKNRSGLG